jgi:hypothetical protein
MSVDLAAPDPPRRLSDDLRMVLEASNGGSMKVRGIIESLRGRGLQMVVILLCLPFLTPVMIPGISIPFGIAIAVCGIRIAFGHKPWLPNAILDRTISHTALERMVRYGCAFYGKIERVIRPRWSFLFEGPVMVAVTGTAIAVAGILLSLPIPPPFPLTNTIPGVAIILLSLGLLERDGLLILLGHLLTLVAIAYVFVIFSLGRAGVEHLWRWLTGA